jgi:hypothetical protein
MATRHKTIQFAVQSSTVLIADAIVTNLAQITAFIPESIISFGSVTCEIAFADVITATGGTITEHRVAASVNGAAYTTTTETDDIANTGENIGGVVGPWDFTAHFTANWGSATSRTLDTRVYFDQNTGTTQGMQSVSAVWTITYAYDDDPTVNPTQIKTVHIPLESLVSSLPTVANSNFGTNQIPQLTGAGGMLPEDGVVIRGYSFILEGNSAAAATTDFGVSVNIDSGTSFAFATVEGALASDVFMRYVWNPVIPATSAAHQFQLWSTLAARFHMLTVMLVVTYEFAPAASDTILNSLLIPVELASPIGVTTLANASRFTRNIFVQEPGTISLQQSAVRMNWNTAATPGGPSVRVGSQAVRNYVNAANVACGMYCLQHRIDAGGAQGAGMTLGRGANPIVLDAFATSTANQITNINGYIILNYHSGKVASGLVGQHAHTVHRLLAPWNAALLDRDRYLNYSFPIPEANYWIIGSGFTFIQWVLTAAQAITFDVQVKAGESKGAGYLDIYADAMQTDAERNCSIVWMRGRDVFRRYPEDPDPDRLDIEVARDYRLFTAVASSTGMMAIVTYHGISYTSTLTIAGSAGGTVNIEVFRADTDEKILELSRVGNGTVSATWYDNTLDCYVVAYESGSLLGRSSNFNFGD